MDCVFCGSRPESHSRQPLWLLQLLRTALARVAGSTAGNDPISVWTECGTGTSGFPNKILLQVLLNFEKCSHTKVHAMCMFSLYKNLCVKK